MSRLITASERIIRARALIQNARDLPLSDSTGIGDFSYIAQVKDLMQQARDLIKFISYSPSASPEMKEEVAQIFKETELAEKEILHR